MARNITQKQKTGYYLGMILTGIGIIMFTAPFIDVLFNGLEPNERGLPESFKVALVGFVLLAIGNILRSISARGLAGSGLLLAPKQARKDLEPYSRMAGGMIQDALEESGGLTSGKAPEKVMIRCQVCKKLNEEDSRFCQECGEPI
ncbi:MAG: hypothetical protein VX764_02295 [Planctomycetota bacterium]|nr:hypothetical protein [Planctomycetota bacterium]